MKYSLLTLIAALVMVVINATLGFADEVVATATEATDAVCVSGISTTLLAIAVGIVPACSALANFVGKDTILGKLINFLAMNFTVKKAPKE